jgi:ribose/xylose/arabinose/galactoside ABC-type transport system permease subunit
MIPGYLNYFVAVPPVLYTLATLVLYRLLAIFTVPVGEHEHLMAQPVTQAQPQ